MRGRGLKNGMQRILLVRPSHAAELESVHTGDSHVSRLAARAVRAFMVPLDLATVAALTPPDLRVDLWDEAVRGPIGPGHAPPAGYDLVGITGYEYHYPRVKQLSAFFRARGALLAVGGPGVSSAPEYYRDLFDVLFIGEAEATWPAFIADWRTGRHRREYRQLTKVSLDDSPPPRWDAMAGELRHYLVGAVQTTRGCPFGCEFCDVIYIYGRQARHKSIDRVLAEVAALERRGFRHVFFCDDNFIGNPGYARALLRELIRLNGSLRRPLSFSTQLSLNVSEDDELLALLADANFSGVLIGVETPNLESLVEAHKPQNYRADILGAVRKIQGYGLPVWGGMIVGFDHDDRSIFETQFAFLQAAGIAMPILAVLGAPVGTPLWTRLQREDRVVQIPGYGGYAGTPTLTNIIPKQMTRAELMAGYRDLVRRTRRWDHFEARMRRLLLDVRRRPRGRRSWMMTAWWAAALLALAWRNEGGQARGSVLRLLGLTVRRAPWMLEKVAPAICAQQIEASRVQAVAEAIDAQLRLEAAEPDALRPVAARFVVPEAFRAAYRWVFPALHARVQAGLADSTRTNDVLITVTRDVLARCGSEGVDLEEPDAARLRELCDRSIAAQGVAAIAGDAAVVAGSRWLADDILHAVEQDMR
jgi:radical SAM superfamily enzyme YgiQ (UPF0313 family)